MTITSLQTQGLTTLFSQVAQSNQVLANEQDRSALAAQRALDQVTGTIQALTQENGALKAKLVETDARVAQQQASFDTQLNAMRQVIQEQGQMTQTLMNRTTAIEGTQSSMTEQLNRAVYCVAVCRNYIYAIYHTLWNGSPPNIPNP